MRHLKISASEPTTCKFILHFKSAPDLATDVGFATVTDPCGTHITGGQYYLPDGIASRAVDASVETGVPPNDAALEVGVTDAGDASSDAAAD